MMWGKFCIFVFIFSNLAFSVSQTEVQKDEIKQGTVLEPLIAPLQQISLESLNTKIEEILVLIEDNRKRTRNLIRNSIAPAKEELTEKMDVLIKEVTQKIDTNIKGLKMDLTSVMNNVIDIKSDINMFDDKLNGVNSKLISDVERFKSNMLTENEIIWSNLNNLNQFQNESKLNNLKIATEFNKLNELNTKIYNKCENNNNKLTEFNTVINELKQFKLKSEINDDNIATVLSEIRELNGKHESTIKVNQSKKVIDKPKSVPVYPEIAREITKNYPINCAEILKNGDNQSGIRTISLTNGQNIPVFCDQLTEGGGWTVFQSRDYRVTPRENFYRNWANYSTGFGDLAGEFWLGLENIHKMTQITDMEMRIDMEDADGVKKYAKYTSFSVGNSLNKYQLNIGRYKGNAGNSFYGHNRMRFSTFDKEHDTRGDTNCAKSRKGAWWYSDCGLSNLNGYQFVGDYLNNYHPLWNHGIYWSKFRGYKHSLRKVNMKFRPK